MMGESKDIYKLACKNLSHRAASKRKIQVVYVVQFRKELAMVFGRILKAI
jgi:hypothetical protein